MVPDVKTLKHAKALSLEKWHKARKLLAALLDHTSTPCGFCEYTWGISDGCLLCEVSKKCHEQDYQVNAFLAGSLKYIEEDLIPYLEAFEPNGETP